MRTPRGKTCALLTAGLFVVTGCGTGTEPADRLVYEQVIADPDATADQIIAISGAPDAVARAGDGSILLGFSPYDREGGEDGAAAWRLLDPDGRTVAQHGQDNWASWVLTGFDDGFLIGTGADGERPVVLHLDGSTSRVKRAEGRVRAGDVMAGDVDAATVYRPGTGELIGLPEPPVGPDDYFQQLTVDQAGRIWGVPIWDRGRGQVIWSADGGRTWEKHSFAMPSKEGYPSDLWASHDVVAVPVSAYDEAVGDEHVVAFEISSDAGRTWHRVVDTPGLPVSRMSYPSGAVTETGRLAFGSADTGFFIGDAGNASFTRLTTPVPFDAVVQRGDLLVGGDEKDVWTSSDEGKTWERLAF